MEVPKTEAVQPVGQGGREPPRQRQDGAEDEAPPDGEALERLWNDEDAVAVDGLAAAMTPELMAAFEELSSQLEPLRYRLTIAEEEARVNRQLAGQHAFLAVPNRREFLRELTHVLEHMGDLSTPPSVLIVHLVGADAVRLRHGRQALDQVLAGAVETLRSGLHPTDVLGSLGGDDFAAILLIGDADAAATKARELAEAVTAGPFPVDGATVALRARIGVAGLVAGMTAEMALAAADADLMASPA